MKLNNKLLVSLVLLCICNLVVNEITDNSRVQRKSKNMKRENETEEDYKFIENKMLAFEFTQWEKPTAVWTNLESSFSTVNVNGNDGNFN